MNRPFPLVVFSLYILLGFIITLTACNKNDEDDIVGDEYPSLKIVNQTDVDYYYITSVSLVGYEFNNLNITTGDSQTFILDQGMPAGYEEINVDVAYMAGPYNSRWGNIKVNFTKGETTKKGILIMVIWNTILRSR